MAFCTVSVNVCRAAEQENGRYSVVDDVGTPPPSKGAFEASPPLTSIPVQALVAFVLLQTSGMSTELFSAGHCTVPPSGIVLPPKEVILGATTAADDVVDAEVVLGVVVVGGVLLALDELRVLADEETLDDRLDAETGGATAGELVVPAAVGPPFPVRAIR